MKLNEILSVANACAQSNSDSKKSALETLSKLLTRNTPSISSKEVFNALIEREKLGSTAIGYGVAIPHARIDGLHKPIGAILHLNVAVNFDAPDDESVDLLFGLLVPMDCSDEQLRVLSTLAELFSSKTFREALRVAQNDEDLYSTAIGIAS